MELKKCDCGGEVKNIFENGFSFIFCLKCAKSWPANVAEAWNARQKAKRIIEGWKKKMGKSYSTMITISMDVVKELEELI